MALSLVCRVMDDIFRGRVKTKILPGVVESVFYLDPVVGVEKEKLLRSLEIASSDRTCKSIEAIL